ncbi:regulatory protein RecX [Arthrobacter sp.]|uniref:regulatory protein RecX n=1 Tax=Arthrobacter sp. TaxID=1667 RepID=UPI003A936D4C
MDSIPADRNEPAATDDPGGGPDASGNSTGRGRRGGKPRRTTAEHGPTEDPEAAARAIILRQLTGSAKSRKQLSEKLADRGIPEDVARQALDRFEELQLIDDGAFADSWVISRARTRGLSRSALGRELREKGIDDELAAAALEQLDDDDELEMARELVRKKVRTLPAGLDRDKGVRRLVSMLGRKGYGPGTAFRVVNEVWTLDSH